MTLGLKRGTVKLEPHNKQWEIQAKKSITKLHNILDGFAIDIQHIGSTSIPSISAKPIIDIVVGVNNVSDILSYNTELENQGFFFRPSDDKSQLLYVMGDFNADTRTHHIHIVKWNGKEWKDYLNFRDFLIANPLIAKEYQTLKKQLAKKYYNNRSSYTKAKNEFITEILQQARTWRKNTKLQDSKI